MRFGKASDGKPCKSKHLKQCHFVNIGHRCLKVSLVLIRRCPEKPEEASILRVYNDSLMPGTTLGSPGLDPCGCGSGPELAPPQILGGGPAWGRQSFRSTPAAVALQGSSPQRRERWREGKSALALQLCQLCAAICTRG